MMYKIIVHHLDTWLNSDIRIEDMHNHWRKTDDGYFLFLCLVHLKADRICDSSFRQGFVAQRAISQVSNL